MRRWCKGCCTATHLSLRLWPQGRPVVEEFAATMRGRVELVGVAEVLAAAHPRLMAHDLTHLTVAQCVRAQGIVTADSDFEGIATLPRRTPLTWSVG